MSTLKPLQIDVVSDVVCPWCYIGKHRIESALALVPDVPVKLNFRPFFLNPWVPSEGISREEYLTKKFGSVEAYKGIAGRVVSLPCWEAFDEQDEAYRASVIPAAVRRRVTIEAGATLGWERYAGDEGAIIGIDHFGASAPAGTIFEKLGFTADAVTDVARRVARDGLRGRIPTIDPGHQPPGLHLRARATALGRTDGSHPSIAEGEPGVARTSGSDPGHS